MAFMACTYSDNFNIEIKKKEHNFIAIVSLKCIKNINHDFLWTGLIDIFLERFA